MGAVLTGLGIPFVSEAYDRLVASQGAASVLPHGMARESLPASISTGAELRAARDALGVTQAALAERLGIAGPVLSQMETGAKDVDPRTDLAVRFLLVESGK